LCNKPKGNNAKGPDSSQFQVDDSVARRFGEKNRPNLPKNGALRNENFLQNKLSVTYLQYLDKK
jgi:hypothetical protein